MVEISPGTFAVEDELYGTLETERMKLDGIYNVKVYKYKKNHVRDTKLPVFRRGNVLCRINTEDIDDLIKLYIRYTYDQCDDIALERSSRKVTVKIEGRTCPNKDFFFVYKGKIFKSYAKYTLLDDHNGREILIREGDSHLSDSENLTDEEDEDSYRSEEEYSDYMSECDYSECFSLKLPKDYNIDKEAGNSIVTNSKIVLNWPKYTSGCCEDDAIAFMIYDAKTGILDALGLYH